jgi:hypothetical protein
MFQQASRAAVDRAHCSERHYVRSHIMNIAFRPRSKSRRAAIASGLLAGLASSGTVSWLTPDGNLVVTLVPGLVVGLTVFGIVSWFSGRDRVV